MFGADRPSDLGDYAAKQRKEKKNDSSKTQWLVASTVNSAKVQQACL